MSLRFTKMHGLGNDYVHVSLFDQRVADPPQLARSLSDRRRGVGSDGLILVAPAPDDAAHVRMEMYNADGSRGEMCGNGIRCVAKLAYERGWARHNPLRVATDAGVKTLELTLDDAGRVRVVRVDMGEPTLDPREIPVSIRGERCVETPLPLEDRAFNITCVSMGNPHAVIFTDSLARVPLSEWGPKIERHPLFPRRMNVHFAEVLPPSEAGGRRPAASRDPRPRAGSSTPGPAAHAPSARPDPTDRLRVATWERGSGITQACGTGACAVCVAGVLTGRSRRRVDAALPGGNLTIEWDAATNHVFMTGPATEVFTGEWAD